MASIASSRRSSSSVSTRSSRRSGRSLDLEDGSSHHPHGSTMSEDGQNRYQDASRNRHAVQTEKFRGRHIQMMAFGITSLILTHRTHRCLNRYRSFLCVWPGLAVCRANFCLPWVFVDGHCLILGLGISFFRVLSPKKITLGEMVSLLPLPGSFFGLANRTLSPSIVSPRNSMSDNIGICVWMDVLVHVSGSQI